MTKDKSDMYELSLEAKELLKLLLNLPARQRMVIINFTKDAIESLQGTPKNQSLLQ